MGLEISVNLISARKRNEINLVSETISRLGFTRKLKSLVPKKILVPVPLFTLFA